MTGWVTAHQAAEIVDWAVIVFFSAQLLIFLLVVAAAGIALFKRRPFISPTLLWRRYADLTPPITIISPAYNEGLTIVESTEALLALKYPTLDVIVVNDGSTDDTLQRLIDRFGLKPVARLCERATPHAPIRGFHASPRQPRLLVVDKENGGGKADAVNAGINASRTPIICITDADTLIEPDALFRAVWPFIDEPLTIAVGGTICIANGSRVDHGRVVEVRLPRNFLALIQTLEYQRSFMLARVGLSRLNALMIVSGAFGLFRREAVTEVGGYSLGSVGEDMDLVVKLHRHFRANGRPYAMQFLPEPVVWTQAPESLGDLGRQRARWQRGSLQTFWTHRRMALNPHYGAVGLIGFGVVLLIDVIGPLAAAAGYLLVPACWAIGLLTYEQFGACIAATFSFGILMSLICLVMEQIFLAKITRARDLAILGAVAMVENFGYRQLCHYWRIVGWFQYLRGTKGWGAMHRQAFMRN